MGEIVWDLLLRLGPFALMAMFMTLNYRLAYRRNDRRTDQDKTGLRAAHWAELAALRALHEDNLRLISDRAGYVLSGKSLFAVYRANLGRLVTLSEDVITALVTANAAQERLEALLAVHGKASANLAWRTPDDDIQLAEIKQATLAAMAAVERALSALEASSGVYRGGAVSTGNDAMRVSLLQPEAGGVASR
jgi:hypothetical protein